MYLTKVAFLLALALCVQSKYIPVRAFLHDLEDHANIIPDNQEDRLQEVPFARLKPFLKNIRTRRQAVVGAIHTNPDKSQDANLRLPIAGDEEKQPSAFGSVTGFRGKQFDADAAGLAFNNANGHSLSVTRTHIPTFGNQMTAADQATLLQNELHKLGANAFFTRNMPSNPNVPDFKNDGGGVDYMFRNKVGASLDMTLTDLLRQNDYSAMDLLNLLRNENSALNLNAGFTRSQSPFIGNTGWQPSGGLTFIRDL